MREEAKRRKGKKKGPDDSFQPICLFPHLTKFREATEGSTRRTNTWQAFCQCSLPHLADANNLARLPFSLSQK